MSPTTTAICNSVVVPAVGGVIVEVITVLDGIEYINIHHPYPLALNRRYIESVTQQLCFAWVLFARLNIVTLNCIVLKS